MKIDTIVGGGDPLGIVQEIEISPNLEIINQRKEKK